MISLINAREGPPGSNTQLTLLQSLSPHSHLYVETLTESVGVFGDSATKELIKVKPGNQGGALI